MPFIRFSNLIFFLFFFFLTDLLFSEDILEMYEGSIHERMLDEQVRNYRAYAKKNAKTFGRAHINKPHDDHHTSLTKLSKIMPKLPKPKITPVHQLKSDMQKPAPKLNSYFAQVPR